MSRLAPVGALVLALLGVLHPLAGVAAPASLSLEEVLAQADAEHPDLELAQARAQLAQAELALAESLDDLRISLEGTLRSGRNEFHQDRFQADHQARLTARKPLFDGGMARLATRAASAEAEARALRLLDARAQRRLTLMTRYFAALLADQHVNAEQELLAVAYVDWDNHRERHAQGQIATWQLAELEARYQDARARRDQALRAAREQRLLLAQAMQRSTPLTETLQDPVLAEVAAELPELPVLLHHARAHNPGLRAHARRLDALRHRRDAARAAYRPRLELEAEAAYWQRPSSTRDTLRAGVNFALPLWQGARAQADVAREQARIAEAQAERDQHHLALHEALQAAIEEIRHLRTSERQRSETRLRQREYALEKARAEHELELKTHLGSSMAEMQIAQIARRAVDYRLALAHARLEALLGSPLGAVAATRMELP